MNSGKSSNNSGRLGRYLKYAIGEIILVVVGILIALQINNWNNDRINERIEAQYITRLIAELEEDKANFQRLKAGFEKRNESVRKLLEIWNQDQMKVQDTAAFWKDFFRASGEGPWYKEPVIWTQLVQSGELKLMQDQEVIEALFAHYSEVKKVADNYNGYPLQTTNEARKFIAFAFSESNFLMFPRVERSAQARPPAQALEVVFKRRNEIKDLNVRSGIISTIHIGEMNDLIESVDNCISLLKKE